MAYNNSGNTYLNSLVPFPGSTGTSASYLLNLTHYACYGRRICSRDSFPVTADLSYNVQNVSQIGDGLYLASILATGTVSYKPTNSPCPVSEPVYAFLSVPVTSDDTMTIAPGECICALNGLSCSCNTSSSVNISAAFTIAQ